MNKRASDLFKSKVGLVMLISVYIVSTLLVTASVLTSGQTFELDDSFIELLPTAEDFRHALLCMPKSSPDAKFCVNKVTADWNITVSQLNGIDHNIGARSFCCALWDVGDCLMDSIKRKCNSRDISILQKGKNLTIKKNQAHRCQSYKYHSNACPYRGKISPKINKVLKLIEILKSKQNVNVNINLNLGFSDNEIL